MNWTGGRLRRHSHNKRGMLEKIQKQHFAKARIKRQHGRLETPRRIPFSDKSKTEDGNGDDGGDKRGWLSAKDEKRITQRLHHSPGSNKNPTYEYPSRDVRKPHLPKIGIDGHQPMPDGRDHERKPSNIVHSSTSEIGDGNSENLDELTAIKRKLLQRGDWATLCVTRPLKMGFMPVDQRERVGKRRRMTEEDRSRQAAPVKQVISPEFYRMQTKRQRRERSASVLDDISIRIGKPRQRRGSSIMPSHMPNLSQQSSEPMLLDKEEAGYFNQLQNTPTRLPLEYWSPCINPYTPQEVDDSPESLAGITNDSMRLPLIGSTDYTPIVNESWDPSTSRVSSASSIKGPAKKRLSEIANGFLGSTPGSMESQPVPGFESQRYQGMRETPVGLETHHLHRYGASQAQRIYDKEIGDVINTSPSGNAEHNLATHSPTESASMYLNSRGRGCSKRRDDQRYGSPRQVASQIYESIETEENESPSSREDILTPDGESVTTDATGALLNSVYVSTIPILDNRVDKHRRQGISDDLESTSGRTIFGQKLDQETAHIPGKEDSWMRFIFEPQVEGEAAQFQNIDPGITRSRRKSKITGRCHETDSSILKVGLSCGMNGESSSNPKSTVQTCKNTSLNSCGNSLIPSPTNPASVIETDFLSNLSPMEGLLDDGLAQVSVYNNATRTIRSPGTPSRTSSFDWDKDQPRSVQRSQEVWDARSVSLFSERNSGAHISMKNQPATPIADQTISSPDPLAMDNIYDWGSRTSVAGSMHFIS